MKALLKQLDRETFILDVREELTECPTLEGYPLTLADGHSIEVDVTKGQSMNEIFIELSRQNIHVISMRNKANRLEELFFDMVEKNLIDAAGGQTDE